MKHEARISEEGSNNSHSSRNILRLCPNMNYWYYLHACYTVLEFVGKCEKHLAGPLMNHCGIALKWVNFVKDSSIRATTRLRRQRSRILSDGSVKTQES